MDSDKEVPVWGTPWWSPNSRHVYFMKGVKGVEYQWHLWRVSADGGKRLPFDLTLGRQIGGLWLHPDGRRLATTDFKVNLEMWVMENVLPKPNR